MSCNLRGVLLAGPLFTFTLLELCCSSLKRLGVTNIPAIEEVNLFKEDGDVIHFSSPKVQASIGANTYVISGSCETKKLQDLLPGIINQLGPDNLQHLKNIAESYSASAAGASGADLGASVEGGDAVPDFVDFESVSQAMD